MYVVIAGAGMVGGELAKKLHAHKHDVVVIDPDVEKCDALYSETGVVTISGNAGRMEILKAAEIHKADMAVAATGNDADNLAFTILAKSMDVPEVIARMRDPSYENAYHVAGASSVVRVTDMMVEQMLGEVEKPDLKRITVLGGGKGDIYKVVIREKAKIVGHTISEITKKRGYPAKTFFIAVYHANSESFTLPRGQSKIESGDEVFVIASQQDVKKVEHILTA